MASFNNVSIAQVFRSPRKFVPRVFSTARFRIVILVFVVLAIVFLFQPRSEYNEDQYDSTSINDNDAYPQVHRPKLNKDTMYANSPPAAVAGGDSGSGTHSQSGVTETIPSSQLLKTLQNFYAFDHGDKKWRAKQNTGSPHVDSLRSAVVIITWNVDFMADFPDIRMEAAISYLRSVLVTSTEESDTLTPAVLLLQEISSAVMKTITSNSWVRKHYYLSDITNAGWGNPLYGTLTLVDRRLNIGSMFRIKYARSKYGRDVLFTDLLTTTVDEDAGERTLRIGNTHLESLQTTYRPEQLKMAANYMKEQGIYAAVLAGDFNPIGDDDGELPQKNGLKDAYLEAGFPEDLDRGHTWGYQTENNIYPPRRMDKILVRGNARVEQPSVIARGRKVTSGRFYISDHYGLTGTIRIQ